MSLTAKDVAEITRLLEESSFTELTLEMDGLKLMLRRGSSAARPAASAANTATATASAASVAPAAPSASAAPAAPAATAAASAAAPADASIQVVRAPLLGTFYRAPKPGAPPFVEVGAVVEPDTIVGIIEVMKLMNTVRAGVRGTVTQILARDGVLVEYDEPILHVRP